MAGIPITELLDPAAIERLVKRTREGGAEIVSLLKTGSAFYAPASAACEMAEAIIKDKKKILPCAAYLTGEYGINDLFIGVPVKLGRGGIEQVIEITLRPEEEAALKKSAEAVKGLVEAMKKLDLLMKYLLFRHAKAGIHQDVDFGARTFFSDGLVQGLLQALFGPDEGLREKSRIQIRHPPDLPALWRNRRFRDAVKTQPVRLIQHPPRLVGIPGLA